MYWLTKDAIKILAIFFSYNENFELEQNFKTTSTTIQRIPKEFLWNSSNAKIKHETVSNDFQNQCLKNVDISSKTSSLRCSWVERLFNENSYDSKLIPLHFVNNAFGKNFIFHSNLTFKTSVFYQFPTFNVNILQSWKRNFLIPLTLLVYKLVYSLSQFLWFNNYITIDNNYVQFKEIPSHNINSVNQLFTSEAEFKDWNHIKREFWITDNLYYKFTQILNVFPKKWRKILRENRAETCVIYLNNHLIKNNLFLS